jgi:hypothetical protein
MSQSLPCGDHISIGGANLIILFQRIGSLKGGDRSPEVRCFIGANKRRTTTGQTTKQGERFHGRAFPMASAGHIPNADG